MNTEIADYDSNESDVFIIKEIKPVFINSSQLLQSTLLETFTIKGSLNPLNAKRSEKNEKERRGKKRGSDLNEIKQKKIKGGVSEGGTFKKILSKAIGSERIKNKAQSIGEQSTNPGNGALLGKVKKKGGVKNVQKCINSYLLKKKIDVNDRDSEEAEIVKLGDSTEISSGLKGYENINKKSNDLLKLKNIKMNDNKSVEIEKKLNKTLTINNGTEENLLENACKMEKSFKICDVNVGTHSGFTENFINNCKLNSEFFSFEGFQDNFYNDNSTEKEKYTDYSELLYFQLKKIMNDEMKKQIDLESQSLKNGKVAEKLLLEYDCKIIEKFFNLNKSCGKVFVKLLGRKKGWHRISTIHYPNISENLNIEFEVLHKEGFIDNNIEEENLKTQMNLLTKQEVLELCKAFNVCIKSSSNRLCRKETLITYLISNCEKQKSALDMFKVKSSTTRLDILKYKVKTYLQSCVKLNNKVFETFYKILLLFSFAHYHEEEDKRFIKELFMWLQVLKNIIKFPNYKLSQTVVFETLEDFEEYKNSLLLQENFETAINDKNYDGFISAYNKAKVEFKKLLENNKYCERFLNLKPFLRKFSAGTVYARILTKYCNTFKKQSSGCEISSTAQLLLNQNLFLTRKKGEWYEILAKAFENEKQNDAAAELIIKSLRDPCVDEIQKLSLQLRGQSILKKKTYGISDIQLKDLLNNLCTLSVQEPLYVEIKGKALEGNESGFKSVYVQELEHGKVYTSVEDRAISYYKTRGFKKGYHSEGFIIQSIYFLLFFDIIYGLSPEGVFLSPYQKAPLDFGSACFFHNRKEEIELLMNDLLSWDNEQIEIKIRDSYYKHYNTTCIVTWNDNFTPELLCELIKCITMPRLVSVFRRLVKNFRISRRGFPDLTLWNPDTKNCMFVEVKSPRDKLSPAQRVWLDYLKNIGLDCEVCNVKNFSSKSFG